MNTKEKFNAMIRQIEDSVNSTSESDIEIADAIKKQTNLGDRDLNVVMNYLVGDTLLHYIRDRKMMASYRYLISKEDSKISEAIQYVDPEKYTHSSFDKAFKRTFGVSPSDAQKKRDETLWIAPSTWESISGEVSQLDAGLDDTSSNSLGHTDSCLSEIDCVPLNEATSCATTKITKDEVKQMRGRTIFGIPEAQYNLALQASELQALYGMDDTTAAFAFELYQSGIDLKLSFKFVDELYSFGLDNIPIEEWDGPEDRKSSFLKKFVFSESVRHLRFHCGLSVAGAFEFLNSVFILPKELKELEPRLIQLFVCRSEIDDYIFDQHLICGGCYNIVNNFWFFKECYDYFLTRTNGQFNAGLFWTYVYFASVDIPHKVAYDYALEAERNPAGDEMPSLEDIMCDEDMETPLFPLDPFEEEEERWHRYELEELHKMRANDFDYMDDSFDDDDFWSDDYM